MKQVDKNSGDTCPSAATHLLGTRSTPKTYQAIGQAPKADQGPISPEVQANFIEDWTLWWLNDLFRLGFKRQIQEQDLYQILESRRAKVLGQLLYDNWEREKTNARIKNRVPSLLRALVRSFWNEYLRGYICLEIGDACLICMPLVLRMILVFIQDSQTMDPPPAAIKGFGLAFGMFLISQTMSILFQHWSVCSLKTGIFIRTSLTDLVFKKATTISAKSRLLYPDGSIINLMSTDISRIDYAMVPLLISIAAPINITAIMVILIRLMGPSALLGAFMLMLSNPVQAWGLSKLGPIRKQASQFTDSRI
ncbi:hypothetical protein BGZ80_001474, partial [Entomortierella chlamydospora]